MPVNKKSGLRLFPDYQDSNGLVGLGVLQVLFRLYDTDGPLTVNELYSIESGYGRAQLGLMAEIGLVKGDSFLKTV